MYADYATSTIPMSEDSGRYEQMPCGNFAMLAVNWWRKTASSNIEGLRHIEPNEKVGIEALY